jgi:hypothetical protein
MKLRRAPQEALHCLLKLRVLRRITGNLAMATETSVVSVSKLDAAHAQLRTAITLWFTDGDPISTHALAFAAYEVVHVISKKRNPLRRDLLFDTDLIKDEYRSEFNNRIKRYAYFFKHADRNHDAVIDFNPEINHWLILFAVLGRELCGLPASQEESTFLWWSQIHYPELLTEAGHKMIASLLDVKTLNSIRSLSKADFFQALRDAQYLIRKYSASFPVGAFVNLDS